jgi:ketosteroid isomerase-like protein
MSSSIVQDALRALAGNDPDQMSAVLTEDAEWLSPPGNATAVALEATNHLTGREAIVRFFTEDLPRLFVADLDVTLHGFHEADERVVVELTMTATLASGNHYANDYCLVFELEDGLIHRVREYVDTARGHRMVFAEAPRPVSPMGS